MSIFTNITTRLWNSPFLQLSHAGLALLLLVYISLSIALSTRIPLSKAPDEYVHFLYIRFLADHARPPINAQERQVAGYKSDQPPLYHSLVAVLTSGIDISEPPSFKFTWSPHRRQLIDIVLPRAILIRTEDETWPYSGLFLAWFAGRWLSTLFSALTLAMTYLITLELFPNQGRLALAASGALAFLPRYIFTGAVLSDDNLIGLLMALFLWGVVRLVKKPQVSWPWFAALGGIIGLALSTKYSVVLVPFELLLLLIWLAQKQPYPWQYGFTRLLASGLAMAIIAGGWFGFIIWNFNQVKSLGPLLGIINPFIAGDTSDETSAMISGFITGNRALINEVDPGITEGNLFDWSRFLFEQFWDVPVFGSPRLYPVLVAVLPALALCLLAIFGWRRWNQEGKQRLWESSLQAGLPAKASTPSLAEASTPPLGVLLLHLFTFMPIPLLRFALTGQIHDTAQARHLLFPVGPALAILLAAGVMAAFPRKWQPWAMFLPATFSLILAIAHLYYYSFAFPAPLPVRTDPSLAGQPEQPFRVEFADGLHLQGYDWQLSQPEALVLNLYWGLASLTHEDYWTEVTLYDSEGIGRRYWLSQPAAGRFPTRAWDIGDSVRDMLQIPLTGLSPGPYQVKLRLLDWDDKPLASTVGDTVTLMTFQLNTYSQIQSPVLWSEPSSFIIHHLSFIQSGRRPVYRYRATIPLLTPQGQEADLIGPNQQIFSPIRQAEGLQLFMVDYDWPSGVYGVRVDGVETQLTLAVKNFEWRFNPPQMMKPIQANFNDEIRLLGYDLPTRRVKAGEGIPLVLYWQSLRRITKSYIIFDRLLNVEQQAWGGYDRLPKETYPTALWVPGEIVTDGFAMPVDQAAPDGIYHIVIGLYDEADPGATSLPLVEHGQRLEATHVRLGPVKIGGPPAGATMTQPRINKPLNVDFGGVIRLLGYDLNVSEQRLKLRLYWQSLSQTVVDYTVFVHLLDETNELVAQGDHLPANGRYPTSLWDAGDIVPGNVEISLSQTPPGRYKLLVGLYDLLTGGRLPVTTPSTGAQDNLMLEVIDK